MKRRSEAAIAALELEQFMDAGAYAHAAALALDSVASDPQSQEGNSPGGPHETRYVLTDLGRRELAMEALFGQSTTVAESKRSA
jgi:hypothetical protein